MGILAFLFSKRAKCLLLLQCAGAHVGKHWLIAFIPLPIGILLWNCTRLTCSLLALMQPAFNFNAEHAYLNRMCKHLLLATSIFFLIVSDFKLYIINSLSFTIDFHDISFVSAASCWLLATWIAWQFSIFAGVSSQLTSHPLITWSGSCSGGRKNWDGSSCLLWKIAT